MLNFIQLAGTLFVPVTHKNLQALARGVKYENLKSLVIDTEDSISNNEIVNGMTKLQLLLESFTRSELLVFIRPRNTKILQEMLLMKNIDKIDGFILPKFSLENADIYLNILKNTKHHFMPSIEGKELFKQTKLLELHDKLVMHKEKIILVRFGLEDMLRQLKMRRRCEDSIFDLSVGSFVLGNFIALFKSSGFAVSGGVYPCFEDKVGFEKDVLRDLKEGLFSKTIIHPNQIDIINELYKVTQKEFDEAQEICSFSGEILKQNGKMAEMLTMRPYSEYILSRASFYGIKK